MWGKKTVFILTTFLYCTFLQVLPPYPVAYSVYCSNLNHNVHLEGSWIMWLTEVFLSFINILWISNFDIVFGCVLKKLDSAVNCYRGGCICKNFFFFIRHNFFGFDFKRQSRTKNDSHIGPWQGSFYLKDHSYNERFLFKWIFIYFFDSNLYEMTACRPFCLITVPSPSLSFMSI